MNYIIAIPSYKRYQLLKDKTLKVLRDNKISNKLIYIFVANKSEYNNYIKTIPNNMYNKIIIGKKGLKNQRNFITKYFPENINIVNMDDDINSIKELYNVKTSIKKSRKNYSYKLKDITNLDRFIKNAFKLCYDTGLYLWGVYPIANAFFMNHTVSKNLKFIVGPFWGVINRHNSDLFVTINEKENVERTIKYYIKDKGVIRFNNITISTNYYKNPGGMQAEDKNRKAEALKSAKYLVNKYPSYTKLYLGKKSGVAEVKLIKPRK